MLTKICPRIPRPIPLIGIDFHLWSFLYVAYHNDFRDELLEVESVSLPSPQKEGQSPPLLTTPKQRNQHEQVSAHPPLHSLTSHTKPPTPQNSSSPKPSTLLSQKPATPRQIQKPSTPLSQQRSSLQKTPSVQLIPQHNQNSQDLANHTSQPSPEMHLPQPSSSRMPSFSSRPSSHRLYTPSKYSTPNGPAASVESKLFNFLDFLEQEDDEPATVFLANEKLQCQEPELLSDVPTGNFIFM